MQDRNLTDGEAVYRITDSPDSVFVVLQGYILVASGDRRQALGPGSAFSIVDDRDPLPGGAAHGVAMVRIYSGDEARAAAAAAPIPERPAEIAAVETVEAPDEQDSGDDEEDGDRDDDWAPIRFIVADAEIAEQIEYPELDIELFPFIVGRADGKSRKQSVDLALPDEAPYQLSRRHFMIEESALGFEIVDCGSYHGTIVNGAKLGGDQMAFRATLNPGENEIVAGTSSSPFRFILVLDDGSAA